MNLRNLTEHGNKNDKTSIHPNEELKEDFVALDEDEDIKK